MSNNPLHLLTKWTEKVTRNPTADAEKAIKACHPNMAKIASYCQAFQQEMKRHTYLGTSVVLWQEARGAAAHLGNVANFETLEVAARTEYETLWDENAALPLFRKKHLPDYKVLLADRLKTNFAALKTHAEATCTKLQALRNGPEESRPRETKTLEKICDSILSEVPQCIAAMEGPLEKLQPLSAAGAQRG